MVGLSSSYGLHKMGVLCNVNSDAQVIRDFSEALVQRMPKTSPLRRPANVTQPGRERGDGYLCRVAAMHAHARCTLMTWPMHAHAGGVSML